MEILTQNDKIRLYPHLNQYNHRHIKAKLLNNNTRPMLGMDHVYTIANATKLTRTEKP